MPRADHRPSHAMGDPRRLDRLLARAIERRVPLARDATITAYRLLNGPADGLPGVTVDYCAGVLVANLYSDEMAGAEQDVVAALARLPGTRAVYVKRRPRTAARLTVAEIAVRAPDTPAWGEATGEIVVREGALRFLIRPAAGLSTGLFLDMREMRARVRSLAARRTVLNLFAYTCAFGVAAAAGGARRVLNIDAARPALEWGKANYHLNALAADPYDFVYGDVFDWLRRLERRAVCFDLVIADPPSFSTVKGRRFAASHDYAALAADCARVVAPGGLLLCCANEARLSRAVFHTTCLHGVKDAGRTARLLSYDHAPALDFPRLPAEEGSLKALLLALS